MRKNDLLRTCATTLTISGIVLSGAIVPAGFAAETITDYPGKTTQVVLRLDTPETVEFRTHVEENPPALVIEFLGQRVFGSLPERSVIEHGVISEIQTRYIPESDSGTSRAIDYVRIVLAGPYAHQVRAEPGKLNIEFRHPAGVLGDALEVSLGVGTIVTGLTHKAAVERFQAMQKAMEAASSTKWTLRASSDPWKPGRTIKPISSLPSIPVSPETASIQAVPPPAPRPSPQPLPRTNFFLWVLSSLMIAGAAVWIALRMQVSSKIFGRASKAVPIPSQSSAGIMLVDQLVWQAFERQGNQLIKTVELERPKARLRIIEKDGKRSALLCLSDGAFCEKQTVEEVILAMQNVSISEGVIVTPGSFTVPAQRRAKSANITLIGRGGLSELLIAGATSEYVSKELEALRVQLQEATGILDQYMLEFESLRQQRNDASWSLGEERVESTKRNMRLSELLQQLQQHQTEAQRREQDIINFHKRWEEGQWYLGEAHARIRYLEEQIGQLQDNAERSDAAQREIDQYVKREHALQDQIKNFQREIEILRSSSDRRRYLRVKPSDALVELRDDADRLLFSGIPRDLSSTGIGFDTQDEFPIDRSTQVSLQLAGQSVPIASKGRFVWQRKNPDQTSYQSGLEFIELSAEDCEVIEHVTKSDQF